jgi:hypothetical protein
LTSARFPKDDGGAPTRDAGIPIVCIECARAWIDPRERWRAYVARNSEVEIGFFCAECAEREFEDGERRA